MRVVFTNLWAPPGARDADAVIEADELRRELAAELVRRGYAVRVVQGFRYADRREVGGVDWRFVRLDPAPRALLGRLGDPDPILRWPATELLAPVRAFRPDVVHAFDLVAFPTLALLPRPLVVTFHGGAPARRLPWRVAQHLGLRGATLLFTAAEQGRGYGRPVVVVPETSTKLRRVAAPRLRGSPALLWVGRLDPVKDPLTVLRGVRRLRETHPDVHLTMVWTDAPLYAEVAAFVAEHLPGQVTLLGRRPRSGLAALYSGADRLVQGSRREVCGRALLEAMACGVPPVVPDLPSSRTIVPEPGLLFPAGDVDGFVRAVTHPVALDLAAWFEEHLSFGALADRVAAVYAEAR